MNKLSMERYTIMPAINFITSNEIVMKQINK